VTLEGPDGDRQDPRSTARLAEILAQAPILFDRLNAVALAGASSESEATKDASVQLGHHVRILASDHLSSGIEHLVVWHRLLTASVQPFGAHMTLIRGAMEGAVTCRWLIDPREDSAERVRRGVALLFEDYGNRRDFERDFRIPASAIKPPGKSAADRFQELAKDRDAAKIGRMKVPSMTYRFGGYTGLRPGPGRAIYELLSAYAHGKQWKGLTVKFEVVEDAAEVPGGRVVKITANDDMSGNDKPIWPHRDHQNWPHPRPIG
jgi:hypothetical protein